MEVGVPAEIVVEVPAAAAAAAVATAAVVPESALEDRFTLDGSGGA
jgi:hypothetical protein